MIALLLSLASAPPAEPKAVVAALFAAFNRHDAAALSRLYAPDARLTSPDFCRPRGHADVARSYQALFAEFPDIRDHVEAMFAEGDRVAVRFRAVSVKGRLSLPIQTMLRVRGGLIVEDDAVFDTGGQPCR
jgi:ketosteroid isomerase-like protein